MVLAVKQNETKSQEKKGRKQRLNQTWTKSATCSQDFIMTHCFADRLPSEVPQFCEMARWVEMYKEIAVLRDEIEVQKELVAYWEGRWKHEYSEKIELLHKNLELKRKYEGISEEALEKAQRVENAKAQVKASQIRKRGAVGSVSEEPSQAMAPSKVQKVTQLSRPPWTLGALDKRFIKGSQTGQRETSTESKKMASHLTCDYCGKANHTENSCWRKGRRCLRCGSAEHRIAYCPIKVRKKKGTQQPTKADPGPSSGEGTGMKNLVSSDSEDGEGTGHRLL